MDVHNRNYSAYETFIEQTYFLLRLTDRQY